MPGQHCCQYQRNHGHLRGWFVSSHSMAASCLWTKRILVEILAVSFVLILLGLAIPASPICWTQFAFPPLYCLDCRTVDSVDSNHPRSSWVSISDSYNSERKIEQKRINYRHQSRRSHFSTVLDCGSRSLRYGNEEQSSDRTAKSTLDIVLFLQNFRHQRSSAYLQSEDSL